MHRYVIVEDELIVQLGTAHKMKMTGCPFELAGTAQNGRTGLELILREKPDLAIIDMNMPDMDGILLMRRLREEGIPVQLLITSGYSDFSYAHAAIQAGAVDYLLKPFSESELQNALAKVLAALRSDMGFAESQAQRRENEIRILAAYLDGIPERSALPEFEALNIDASCGCFLVAEVQTPSHEWQVPFTDGFDEMAMIPSQSDANLRHLVAYRKTSTDQIVPASLAPCLGKPISAGISQPAETLKQLFQARKQARFARMNRPLNQTGYIGIFKCFDDIPAQLPADLVEQLLYCLEIGDRSWLEHLLENHFEHAAYPGCTYNAMLSSLRSFFETALKRFACHASASQLPTLFQFDCLLQYSAGDNSLQDDIVNFLCKGFRPILNDGADSCMDLVSRIRRFVEEHYAEELSLERTADLFHVNSSYLSQLFSQRIGITFSSYITQLRLKHAQQLLRENPIETKEVARLSGFSNAKYFYRVFKQHVGVTPTSYRNEHASWERA